MADVADLGETALPLFKEYFFFFSLCFFCVDTFVMSLVERSPSLNVLNLLISMFSLS
jgi:hypothetical protein